MNVYVESNFVLELTLLQDQHESCERILTLCEQGQLKLIIPAYSLAEPNEKLNRQDKDRKRLAKALESELKELSRSTAYETESTAFQEVVSLLTRSGSEERQRFTVIRDRLLQIADIISLDRDIAASAASYERQPFGLSPQDALVFASILWHLNETSSGAACFLTLNSKDFEDIDIQESLAQYKCEIKFKFSHGLSYIQSQI